MKLTNAELKTLTDKWYLKLKKSGFVDIERADGTLHDVKDTAGSRDRDAVFDFFYRLDHYLTNNTLPRRDRRILELYALGTQVEGLGETIVKKARVSSKTIYRTITKYREILLGPAKVSDRTDKARK